MDIIKSLSHFHTPKTKPNTSPHDQKRINLQVFLLVITKVILFIFAILNLLTDKPFSSFLNMSCIFILILLSIYFKKSSHFENTFMIYCLNLLTLVTFQHLISPKYQSSNLLWVPLLIFVSTYLLDKKRNLFVMTWGVIFSSFAYIRPDYFIPYVTPVPVNAANIINIVTILISFWTIHKIAGSFSREERVIRENLELGIQQIKDLSETNMALVSILSHDLSTPLMTSKLLVKKIQKGNMEATDQLKEQIDHIQIMLEDVKKLSALKSGKLRIKTSPILLVNTIDKVLKDMGELASRKSIKFRVNKEDKDNDLLIASDSTSLRRSVLMNILSNAIKFSYDNTTIDLSITHLKNNKVQLSIQDYGMGMPENISNTLFDFSAITTREGTHNEKGTGFGMPLVKLFMDAYHGDISLISNEREDSNEESISGTTISLTFDEIV